ncbi:MAG TPA: hypothetical protein VI121_11560, partial [Agromyces sp.]
MGRDPAARALVLQVALPAVNATALQSVVPACVNVTVPVGVAAVPATVAVKVTLCPEADGFADEASV